MKVIIAPKVTLVAKQVFLGHPDYEIPDDGNDAVKIGAFAAKCCYDSTGKNGRANETNQRQILEHLHGSVLEHITATLFIEGVTRALSLESNRHRQNAISQRSTRYTEEDASAIVLEPYYADIWNRHQFILHEEGMRKGDWTWNPKAESSLAALEQTLLNKFLHSARASVNEYKDQVSLLEQMNPLQLTGFDLRKWARGKARNLLPHALETRITYTGNMRAWRWFIESRSSRHAEPEIRRLADAVLTTLRNDFTLYFEDFTNAGDYDGLPEWIPLYHKI